MSTINSIALSGKAAPAEISSVEFLGGVRPRNQELASKEARAPEAADIKKSPDAEALASQTEKMNQVSNLFNRQLRFELQEDTQQMVIKVVDAETGETIRQIPPEYMAKTVQRIDDAVGMILDEQA